MSIKKNKKTGGYTVRATLVNDYVFEFTQAEYDELSRKDDGVWDYVNEVLAEGELAPSGSELRIEL